MVHQTADDVEFLVAVYIKSAFSLYKIMICQLTLLTALLDYLTILSGYIDCNASICVHSI